VTREAIIVSIPHTGTRFLKERLGIEKSVHTHSKWESLYKQVEGKQIIAPLRHPNDVWESWARRKNPPGTGRKAHDSVMEPFPYATFFSAWYNMHTLDMMFDVDFICVDKCDDPRITDWTPVGDGDKGSVVRPATELLPLYYLPFVRSRYGSWQKEVIRRVG
jgi:hypothetical protein